MTRLEQLRLDRRLTPVGLAKAAGVAPATVRRAERGESVRVGSLVKLADFFGEDPSKLQRPAYEELAA